MPKSHDAKPRNKWRRRRAKDEQVAANKTANPWHLEVWRGVTKSLWRRWDKLGLLKFK